MGGLLDLPTAKDFPQALQVLVPSEDRDFSRPKEPSWSNDSYIPAAATFSIAPLTNTAPTIQDLSFAADEPDSFTLVKRFKELTDKLKSILEKYQKKEDFSIKDFQSFFNQNNPIIGKLYTGPQDGKVNDQIISAAKTAESIIGSKINKSVAGIIWNDSQKKFNTSSSDVRHALDLIQLKQ